ncbi:MAG: hypothetical protein WA634_17050, partial [Silvibacterium sp.]
MAHINSGFEWAPSRCEINRSAKTEIWVDCLDYLNRASNFAKLDSCGWAGNSGATETLWNFSTDNRVLDVGDTSFWTQCQKLAMVSQSVPYGLSGRYQTIFANASSRLEWFEFQADALLDEISPNYFWVQEHSGQVSLPEHVIREAFESSSFLSFDSQTFLGPNLLDYFGFEERAFRILFEARKRIRDMRAAFSRKLHKLKSFFFATRSQFCGVSWARRFWFLLHGSHPPKAEGW